MTTEALLAYAHLLAIFTMIVFLASEAALCRPEWLNAAVVERLARVDKIYAIAAGTVLLTGVARMVLGVKGAGWYVAQPLLYVKIGLFVALGLLSIGPTRQFRRWLQSVRADGTLPDADTVRRTRRRIMQAAHIVPFIPLAAVFLARGWG